MIRNSFFTIALLFILGTALGQDITGTWKPVSFKLGNVMEGNIANEKLVFLDTTAASDDSEAKEMQEMMGKMLIGQMKNLSESYKSNGVLLINNGKGKEQQGVYKFDAATNTLKRGSASLEEETYKVVFKEGLRLKLTTKVPTPQGAIVEFTIEFEKIPDMKF